MASGGMPGRDSVMALSQVWNGLWVGSALTVTAQQLSSKGITTLVWATPEVRLPPLPVRECARLYVVEFLVFFCYT